MATLDLTFPQGATWKLALTWRDSDNDPVNLSGYTAAMQIRRRASAPVVLSAATGGAGITLGGVAGTVAVTFPATDTDDVKSGRYVYDLELTSAGGEVTRLIEGTVTVTPEVTQ